MSPRKIPATGINLFQLIYILLREYEEKSGSRALNLSLGNPDLLPPAEVLSLKREFAGRAEYELHTYGEDKNLNGFAEGMARLFGGIDLGAHPELAAVPIPGIKTATALLPLACGLHLGRASSGKPAFRVVTHLPAYDVMGTWSASYLGADRWVWPLRTQAGMRLEVSELERVVRERGGENPDLVFVIRPGNPASAGASEAEWVELIEWCRTRHVRLVNDGAYTTLTARGAGRTHVPLAEVAKRYSDLEWMELYSVSKSFSDPGARLGLAVGSRTFIEDLVLIKGNTESGPVPHVMAAYGELFKDQALSSRLLDETTAIYQARLDELVPKLKAAGLRPACETSAGFFTLWQVPGEVFGRSVADEAKARGCGLAEAFNRMVIDQTGIVGVHFTGPSGEPFIRYAVCSDILQPAVRARLDRALKEFQPRYLA